MLCTSEESPVNAALVEEDEDDETMDGYKIGSSDDETYSFDSKRRTVGKKWLLHILDENKT